ncbi:hypothetical protein INT44_008820 [Umbelopsis vinacea]|uniref:Uncharacterized protein n=1 Tax=Umbelopsis vinacea TaxID=44442 RepID=A0A8H7UB61_9FUNG|nr:hypothetical protein INT44_008820 [Umbelopsis vinacea]
MSPEVTSHTENSIAAPVDYLEDHTSNWGEFDMKTFKLRKDCKGWTSEFYPIDRNSVSADNLYEEASKIVLNPITESQTFEDLPGAQKSFYNRLRRLQSHPNRPGISIASDLLTHTGFESHSFDFITQPKLESKFGDIALVSDADYVVTRQMTSLTQMVIIDDLSGEETFIKRRYQMIDDMLVAATTRHDFFLQNELEEMSPCVYGMLVWRSSVIFFQATIGHAEIVERQSGYSPYSNCLYFHEDISYRRNERFTSSLSLMNREDRETIAYILSGIRKTILQMRPYL